MTPSRTDAVALNRDHLFISYAWEDGALAEWLARKLTAAGYRVWIDRFKMLGGERWPKNIDRAIKTRTFRMIALLSAASIEKENPSKERQMALTLSNSKEREEDFLIPLNVDGLRPSDLGWELSDLNYIAFEQWASGLEQLLKKLESINTPRPVLIDGPAFAAQTFLPANVLRDVEEPLYANCLVVTAIPEVVQRYTISRPLTALEKNALETKWAFFPVTVTRVLAFTDPPPTVFSDCTITRTPGACWADLAKIDGVRSTHVVISLVKKSMIVKCVERGLFLEDDQRTAYFPRGLLPKDKITYRNYKGRKVRVSVFGERRTGKTRTFYQLAVSFFVRSDVIESGLIIELKLRLHLTDPSGVSLDGKAINARRKKITKRWWNHEWLSRQMALVHHLAEIGDTQATHEIVIGTVLQEQVRVSSRLLSATVRPGINDGALEPLRAELTALSAQSPDDGEDDDLEFGAPGEAAEESEHGA